MAVRFGIITLAFILSGLPETGYTAPVPVSDSASVLEALSPCTHKESALERLDCYDRVLRPSQQQDDSLRTSDANAQISRNPHWLQATAQEQQRGADSPPILTGNSGGDNPRIMLTTPAQSPRATGAILAFSCIDNITRMQIMLPTPARTEKGAITLLTDKGTMKTRWFVRDNGYVLEASRGLPGIDEIRQLLSFQARQMTLASSDPTVNGLVFDISTLSSAIASLRAACHW